jgi:hypothetical protein
MKETLQSGEMVDFTIVNHVYIHNICSLLKVYLRELPVPVCTYDLYDMFIASNSTLNLFELNDICSYSRNISTFRCDQKSFNVFAQKQPQVSHVKEIIHVCRMLARLCVFLNLVRRNCESNKMNSKNLAIVFSPNILVTKNKPTGHKQMLADMQSSQEVVEYMIEEAEFLFVTDLATYDEFINQNGTKI